MTILYSEQPVGRRGWLILLGCCVVGFLAVFFGAGGLHDSSMLILAGALVVVVGGPFALMLFSKNFYGKVELTAQRLTVGRERIPVEDIWPRQFIDTLDPTTPNPLRRVENSVSATGDPAAPGKARLAGGAHAVPIGSDYVTLNVRGEHVLVTTPDRAAFLAALRAAFAQTPARMSPLD